MMKLYGDLEVVNGQQISERLMCVSFQRMVPRPLRKDYIAIDPPPNECLGYGAVLASDPSQYLPLGVSNLMRFEQWCSYLGDSDVIRINTDLSGGKARIHVLYRHNSDSNSILLTERCDHYCLMCSQPPRDIDDSALLSEAFELISKIPTNARSLGITGGEPTFYGKRLVELVAHAKRFLPTTRLDILSNGKRFADKSYALNLSSVNHPDLLLAVPLYSAVPEVHDHVVQFAGAFDPTLNGILNLKRAGIRVQIRIVLHRYTVPTLVSTAEFIVANLRFVDEVAIMGLETIGFGKSNLRDLWIDPYCYKSEVEEAVMTLTNYGIPTYLFNQQLCLISQKVSFAYVKSISDWKNEYPEQCSSCTRKTECGGFFSSNVQHKFSEYLNPFL